MNIHSPHSTIRALLGLAGQIAVTASIFATLGPLAALFQVGVAVNIHVYMAAMGFVLSRDTVKLGRVLPRDSRDATAALLGGSSAAVFPFESALAFSALARSDHSASASGG